MSILPSFAKTDLTEKAQDKIYVVLIGDEDLPLQGEGPPAWPPAYNDYTALLGALGGTEGFAPAAIFFDILFENAPESIDEVNALCDQANKITNENGAPVIFAALPDLKKGLMPMPSALGLCDASVETAAVGWRAGAGLYPFSVNLNGAATDTAAAALYRIAAERGDVNKANAVWAPGDSASNVSEMRTVWGAIAPSGQGCRNYRGRLIEKLGHSAKILASGLIPHRAARKSFDYVQPCAYHEVLSARAIINAPPEERVTYAAILDGAYIFVGADVRGIPDFVDSPVHGLLPGVFLHSMALDNMMTFEDRYLRDAPSIRMPMGGFAVGLDVLLQTILLLALALSLAFLRSQRNRTEEEAPQGHGFNLWIAGFSQNLVYFTLFAIVVFTVAAIAFSVGRWAPINYGGVLIAGGGMVFSKPFVESALRRSKSEN